MYNYISGSISDIGDDYIVIDLSGVGYEIKLNKRDLCELETNKNIKVYTHLYVRENEMSLIGFLDKLDKMIFLKLLEVSGIGIKSALAILSCMSYENIIRALNDEDINVFSKVPTIGKKTAQRIILELQGKLVTLDNNNSSVMENEVIKEAKEAMIGLGFTSAEVENLISGIENAEKMDSASLIKLALKRMNNA